MIPEKIDIPPGTPTVTTVLVETAKHARTMQ